MAIRRLLRRGSKAINDLFTGGNGELVQDTENNRLIVHNGSKRGGIGVPNAFDLMKSSLTSGTASGTDNYVLQLPYFTDGNQTGIRLTVTFTNENTAAPTLKVNDAPAAPIADEEGVVLETGDIEAGSVLDLTFVGVNWRLSGGTSSSTPPVEIFTADGTWNKPSGFDGQIKVTVIGGGGGNEDNFAPANSGDGETSSFGTLLSATGGIARVGPDGVGVGGDLNYEGNANLLDYGNSVDSFLTAGGTEVALNTIGGAGGVAQRAIDVDTLGSSVSITIGVGGSSSVSGGTNIIENGQDGAVIVEYL